MSDELGIDKRELFDQLFVPRGSTLTTEQIMKRPQFKGEEFKLAAQELLADVFSGRSPEKMEELQNLLEDTTEQMWSRDDIVDLLDSGDRLSLDIFGTIMAFFKYKTTISIKKEDEL